MRRAASLLLLAAMIAAPPAAPGQASAHQRLSVETEPGHSLEAALGCSWRASGADWSADAEASLEYAWRRRLAFRLSMPGVADRSAAPRPAPAAWRWGDPCVSASYLWRGEGLRLRAGLGYSRPLPRAARPGAQAISPSLCLVLVRDPVILAIGIDARLCLPREAEAGLFAAPLWCGLSLSAWELLNDRVSYRVSVSPGVALPGAMAGGSSPPRFSIGLAMAFSWDEKGWGFQAGWSGAADGSRPGSLDLRGSLRKEW